MLDLDKLRQQIKVMTPRTKLYQALKEELTLLGHWRSRQKGTSRAGGLAKYKKYGSILGKKE